MNAAATAALETAMFKNDHVCGFSSERHISWVADDEPLDDQTERKHVTQGVVLARGSQSLGSNGEK